MDSGKNVPFVPNFFRKISKLYHLFSYGMDNGSSAFMGLGSWFVNSEGIGMGPTYTTFLFQLSFATTATTIVSGGIAERFLTFFLLFCWYYFYVFRNDLLSIGRH